MTVFYGVVESLTATHVNVLAETCRVAACGRCGQASGCPTPVSSSVAWTRHRIRRRVDTPSLAVGDRVEVTLPARFFWSAAFYAYLLPTLLTLIAMLLVAELTSSARPGWLLPLAAGAGLALGAVIAVRKSAVSPLTLRKTVPLTYVAPGSPEISDF